MATFSAVMNYHYGAHLIDWLALGAVFAIIGWFWRTSKVKFYD